MMTARLLLGTKLQGPPSLSPSAPPPRSGWPRELSTLGGEAEEQVQGAEHLPQAGGHTAMKIFRAEVLPA